MAAIMPGCRSLQVTRPGRLLEPHRVWRLTGAGRTVVDEHPQREVAEPALERRCGAFSVGGGVLIDFVQGQKEVTMMTHTPSASRYALSFTSCRTARETSLPLHPAVEEDGMLYAEVTVEAPLSWSERLRAHAAGNGGAS